MNYSKPTTELTIENWPYGNKRTRCRFFIQKSKSGKERAAKVTKNPKTLVENKPKVLTYCEKVIFVEGEDERVYIINDIGFAFSVMKSNMYLTHEIVYPDSNEESYRQIMSLFNELNVIKTSSHSSYKQSLGRSLRDNKIIPAIKDVTQ